MLFSVFDGTYLVHRVNRDIEKVETPQGFVVTVQEVASIRPLTKFGWNIYADNNNYYLSPAIQKVVSTTGDNSYLAKKNGIRIPGKDRAVFEKIMAAEGDKQTIDIEVMRRISNENLNNF